MVQVCKEMLEVLNFLYFVKFLQTVSVGTACTQSFTLKICQIAHNLSFCYIPNKIGKKEVDFCSGIMSLATKTDYRFKIAQSFMVWPGPADEMLRHAVTKKGNKSFLWYKLQVL